MYKISVIAILILATISCKNEKMQDAADSEMSQPAEPIKLSLAEWSFHKALFDNSMTNLEFAGKAGELGFQGVEYVNQFFKDKAEDMAYLDSMKMAAQKAGVASLLIMIDREGHLGDTDAAKRDSAVENHKKWVDAAAYLGCHSIRVNAHGVGTAEEVAAAATDGLSKISQYAATKGINVIVENHGGYSSNGAWLTGVMKAVNLPNCGTLPDFGNFCLQKDTTEANKGQCIEEYDRYKGVEEMIPFAKALSAKSHDFDEGGNEINTDFARMKAIADAAGYTGYWGVEYEGKNLPEEEGIILTRDLIKSLSKPAEQTE